MKTIPPAWNASELIPKLAKILRTNSRDTSVPKYTMFRANIVVSAIKRSVQSPENLSINIKYIRSALMYVAFLDLPNQCSIDLTFSSAISRRVCDISARKINSQTNESRERPQDVMPRVEWLKIALNFTIDSARATDHARQNYEIRISCRFFNRNKMFWRVLQSATWPKCLSRHYSRTNG